MEKVSLFIFTCIFGILTGCSSYDHALTDQSTLYLGAEGAIVSKPSGPINDSVSYWDGDSTQGAPSIVIRLGEQAAYFYKEGKLVGISAISTGREGFDTPTGNFKIIQKDATHKSNLYGDYVDTQGNVIVRNVDVTKDPKPVGTVFEGAPMPHFMRIHGGVGMHEGFLPGVPDSHGCIRMPKKMADTFFANVSVGTPVTVVR